MIIIGLLLVILTATILIGIGVWGMVYNKNLVKMLLSLEVSFNGITLLVLYLASTTGILGMVKLGAYIVFLGIALAIGEISIIVSVILYMFKEKMLKEISQDEVRSEE
ncbi:MAG: NADH-quinone oxidoreductase subunit K [Nitrososphaeria archaeon]|nr:NADH-quinone oxidoreductase subunit K [Conexivisphaerales archaeon]